MPDVIINARTAAFPGGAVVASVDVRLFNASLVQVASGVTDANGNALMGTHAAGDYEVRVFPPAPNLAADTVQNIVVPNAVPDQYFDVYVLDGALPSATDTTLCRCSGYFKDNFGRPIDSLSIQFNEGTPPQLLHYVASDTAHAVIPRRTTVTTDENGYAIVDLIRGAEYEVFIGGLTNVSRNILVPDLLASSLPDVIYPYVDRVEYKYLGSTLTPVAAPTLAIDVGVTKSLEITTVFRSGLRVDGLADVTMTSEDEAVFTLSSSGSTTVDVTGVAVGNADIVLARTPPEGDCGITISPAVGLRGELAVTVSAP